MPAKDRYSKDELQAILGTALQRQGHSGDYGRADLLETARELGLSEAEVLAAEAELADKRELDAEINKQRQMARQGMVAHTVSYAVVNAGLYVVDILTPGGPWFYWPLLGWGIVLAIHLGTTLVAGKQAWEAAAQRELARKRKKQARAQVWEQAINNLTGAATGGTTDRGSGEQRFEQSIEKLVDSALGAVASGLEALTKDGKRNGDQRGKATDKDGGPHK